jgi:hypothetical protein
MSRALPENLLRAVVRVAPDEAQQLRLAREWQRVLAETEAAAERIRRSVQEARCTCQRPAELLDSRGRCTRCWGRAVSRGETA